VCLCVCVCVCVCVCACVRVLCTIHPRIHHPYPVLVTTLICPLCECVVVSLFYETNLVIIDAKVKGRF
jgi:hypothetical protein